MPTRSEVSRLGTTLPIAATNERATGTPIDWKRACYVADTLATGSNEPGYRLVYVLKGVGRGQLNPNPGLPLRNDWK